MNRDELFGTRTLGERASEYLNRRRPPRPKAPEQRDALFDEPGRDDRRFVPLGRPPTDNALFGEPAHEHRRLIPVEGWPDYRQRTETAGGVA